MRFIILISLYLIIDFYAFQAIRTFTKSNFVSVVYFAISISILSFFCYAIISGQGRTNPKMMYIFGVFLALFVPKLIVIIFIFGEDIFRIAIGVFKKITNSSNDFYIPSRRKFISTIALGIAAIPFTSLLYGMFKGKYNYKVLKYNLAFNDLPDAFDGFTITQISDVHSGSFYNKTKVEYAVNLINEQQSDIIVCTGDLVNNTANEMTPWIDTFSTLKAKDGVFSILGNHDYGDYVKWNSKAEKAKNLEDLKTLQKNMGWDLLLNENRTITKNGQSIKLIGVENWGAGGFKKAGDIDKASHNINKKDFKIVLSHDPSYWKEKIKKDDKNYQLTLSGHTHGMQFGIEIPGWFKWSPVKYRYENWAGIYQEAERFINVNRGFGFLGYPGRVGIWPEITVIKLTKKSVSYG